MIFLKTIIKAILGIVSINTDSVNIESNCYKYMVRCINEYPLEELKIKVGTVYKVVNGIFFEKI